MRTERTELIQRFINGNARIALDQAQFLERYNYNRSVR